MEAGAAGQQVDAQPTGTGIVVIAGQFEARSLAKCFHLPNEGTLRAEGGTLVGEREVDDNELVGFDGLAVGEKYIVACYTRGRYEEVRCAAVDPAAGLTLIQQPIQPSPNTLGTQGTHVIDTPAAESEHGSELESGLPDGVTSPVLGGDTPSQGDPTAAEDAQISPGDISGAEVIAPGVAPVSEQEVSQTVDEHLQAEADALKAQQEAEAASAKAAEELKVAQESDEPAAIAQREEAEAAQAKADGEAKAAQEQAEASAKAAEEAQAAANEAKVEAQPTPPATPETPAEPPAEAPAPEPEAGTPPAAEANPPAPDAGTPNASDSSGIGQANGGAVEQTQSQGGVKLEGGGVTVETTTTATPSAPADTPAETPATGIDAQADPSAQPGDGTPVTAAGASASEPAAQTAGESSAPTQALVDQANSLGIENAATLSDDELRQAITEKQATPVV